MFDTPVSTETDLAETASRPLASVQPASRPVASQRLESQLLDPRPTDPRKKCPDLLANEITTLAGHLNAAQYRFLKLLDEFDREQGWAGPGVRSLAHWLNWKCELGDLVAREKVRVARALRELPMIDATFEQGQLLVKALDAMVAEMEKDEREAASETTENVSAETFSVGKPDTPPFKPLRVRRATALVHIAEHYLATRGSGATPLKSSDAYHIHHWADGGETSLDNLVTLCRYHHRALHRDEYRIEHGTDRDLIFIDAQYQPIPPAIHPQFGGWRGSGGVADTAGAASAEDRVEQLRADHRERGVEIDKSTAVTRWAGERMDYSTAVEWLQYADGVVV